MADEPHRCCAHPDDHPDPSVRSGQYAPLRGRQGSTSLVSEERHPEPRRPGLSEGPSALRRHPSSRPRGLLRSQCFSSEEGNMKPKLGLATVLTLLALIFIAAPP